ncbi:MAG: hypothetical protein K2X82_29285 [Gemmataceae bacterium]|nr:hypothetical protein [Gemmataceae bacterium]
MRRPLALASVFAVVLAALAPAAPPSPRAQARIDALEKLLPEYEAAAAEHERAIARLAGSKDETVQLALDGARLRVDALRSVRRVIAADPEYLSWHLTETDFKNWRAGADYFLSHATAGTDPFAGKTSGIRTLRSPVDGQLLFYLFRLPRGYDPAKRYPLDVALHSGAALTWRAGWVDGAPSDDPKRAGGDGRIWVSPCGRGNNGYIGMGDAAVVAAVRDVTARYAVDPDRVTVGGSSMGGTGGFRLAALHPDLFAAAHSLTGGANYLGPAGDGRYDATLLLDNYANTGVCIWDAPKEGWFKQNRAFADGLRDRAAKLPGSYPVRELTDPTGGHGTIDKKLVAEGWEWVRKQKRDPHPKRVVYKTYSLRYDGAYWVHIEAVDNPAAPARVEAEVGPGGAVRVAAENVARLRLDLGRELVGDAPGVSVTVNGGPAVMVKPGAAVRLARDGDRWAPAGPPDPKAVEKRHGLSGPVGDVFLDGPVLLVHGPGVEAAKQVDAAVGRLFGPGDGGAVLHTGFERKADQDVTPADLADKHLVLFGTPKENAVVAKVADRLPVKFLADGVEVRGKAYRGPGVGLTMVYPNPLNPERYVLLVPSDYAGGSPLDLPDYLVGRRVEAKGRVSQQVLAKGWFDARWRLGP